MLGAITAGTLVPVMMDVTPATMSDLTTQVTSIATEVFAVGSQIVSFVLTNWLCLIPLALAILYFAWNAIRGLIKGV